MKLLTVAGFIFGINFSAHAAKIACGGKTEGMAVQFTATWNPGSELKDVQLFGADGSVSKFSVAPLTEYHPRNPAYVPMNRFLLTSDGWSTTSILLPKVSPVTSSFEGYFYDQGHSGTGTLLLHCLFPRQ